MKKNILKVCALVGLIFTTSGCGNSFLETDNYTGVDVETGLNSVANISTALNGTYYQLFYPYFAGNYSLAIGDIPTDLSYWNGKTGHWDDIYTFTFNDTDTYLKYIWEYGYKVADNAARIIEASKAIYDTSNDEEKKQLDLCMAEAYALRAYSQLVLVNIYAHQIKVNGQDFSNEPGIVVIDMPKEALKNVSRSSIGDTYTAIITDLNNALSSFDKAGGDRDDAKYIGKAATYGILARTYLYMENWDGAISAANSALSLKPKTNALAYTVDAYKALYDTPFKNTESFFELAITNSNNWAASSYGTLWSTYNFSPSPKLKALYATTDCRTSIFGDGKDSTPQAPVFNGGKLSCASTGNPAVATNYIVNAPEMYLIIAESYLKSTTQYNISESQNALLKVAKRNSNITSTSDLPSNDAGLLDFIKDERARELFQEGLRLYDLRRWDENADVYAYNSPDVAFTFSNYKISNLVFPIPSAEVNAGFGVEQNKDWANSLPKK